MVFLPLVDFKIKPTAPNLILKIAANCSLSLLAKQITFFHFNNQHL